MNYYLCSTFYLFQNSVILHSELQKIFADHMKILPRPLDIRLETTGLSEIYFIS